MAVAPFPKQTDLRHDDQDEDRIALTDPEPLEEGRMSFLDHLDELRKRLIASVYALLIGCVVAFFFVTRIQAFIFVPLHQALGGQDFIYTKGFEPFMLMMKTGVLAGLLIASPFIIWQLWLFIAPGLYANEKRFAIPFVFFSSVFFLLGATFSHYVAFPWTWAFFKSWETDYVQFLPDIQEAFSVYVKMILAFGLIFQMPTLVFSLARMGLVTAGWLAKNTKYAVLIIFVVAAVISPGTDVVSQALMAGPMLGLYGVSILVAWIFAKKKKPELLEGA
jgi:sec-independent protein translocase protein TatC